MVLWAKQLPFSSECPCLCMSRLLDYWHSLKGKGGEGHWINTWNSRCSPKSFVMQFYPNGMWPSGLRRYWTNIILEKLKERVPSMWLRGNHHPAAYELANAAALESPTLLPVTPHLHSICKGNKVSGDSEWTLVQSYFGLPSTSPQGRNSYNVYLVYWLYQTQGAQGKKLNTYEK